MSVTLIAAMDMHLVIGAGGGLPWRLPKEMRHFVRCTTEKPVIMGRATHASLGGALARRKNIVLTQNPNYEAPGCLLASSVPQALLLAEPADEVMVIGGGEVYRAFLPCADRMILTHIDAELQGDTWFPDWDADDWVIERSEHTPADAKHAYAFETTWYTRQMPS